jgi:PAS domain-containing protein
LELLILSISPVAWIALVSVVALSSAVLGYFAGRQSVENSVRSNAAEGERTQGRKVDIRLTEARLRTILESEPECVKTVDCEKRLLYMNPAGLEMVAAEDLESVHLATVSDLVIPEQRHIFESLIPRHFRENGRKLNTKLRLSTGGFYTSTGYRPRSLIPTNLEKSLKCLRSRGTSQNSAKQHES